MNKSNATFLPADLAFPFSKKQDGKSPRARLNPSKKDSDSLNRASEVQIWDDSRVLEFLRAIACPDPSSSRQTVCTVLAESFSSLCSLEANRTVLVGQDLSVLSSLSSEGWRLLHMGLDRSARRIRADH